VTDERSKEGKLTSVSAMIAMCYLFRFLVVIVLGRVRRELYSFRRCSGSEGCGWWWWYAGKVFDVEVGCGV
jgi:hypothetical protein